MFGYEMVNTIKKCLALAEEVNTLIADEKNNSKQIDNIVFDIICLAYGNRWTSADETVFCMKALKQALKEAGKDEIAYLIWDAFVESINNEIGIADDIDYYRPDLEYEDWQAIKGHVYGVADGVFGDRRNVYNHEARVKACFEAEDIENAPIMKGDVIEVVKGRKYAKGTQFKCLKVCISDFNGKKQIYVGKDENGKGMYVALANCKIISLNDKFKAEYSVGDKVKVKKDVINPQTNAVIVKAGEYEIEGFYTKYNWYEIKKTDYLLVDGGKRLNEKCAEPVGFDFGTFSRFDIEDE